MPQLLSNHLVRGEGFGDRPSPFSLFFSSEGEASLSCGEGGRERSMFTFNLSLMRRLSGWGEG